MHATAEMKLLVKTLLEEKGADSAHFSIDGSTHQVVRFEYRKRPLTFHFPNTGRMNGRSRLNTLARLKRKLREVDADVGIQAASLSMPPETRPSRVRKKSTAPGAKKQPPTHHLGESFCEVSPEAVEREVLEAHKNGAGIPALAVKYRMTDAEVFRIVRGASLVKPALLPRRKNPIKRRRSQMNPTLLKRNREIAKMRVEQNKSYSAIGRMFKLTGARIKQIVEQMIAMGNL